MKNKTFAQKAYDFYLNIELPSVPSDIVAMNPYHNDETKKYSKIFLDKYFSDQQKRIFVFGINPGRFGAGLTGVTFTDPVALSYNFYDDAVLLNEKEKFFGKIYSLEHPRFIMQYKRKKIEDYIQKYKEVFSKAGGE